MLLRNFPSLPSSRQLFFLSRCKFSALTSTPDCTAVDSTPCVRNCSREREGLYNGNVQQNPLCAAASCVTKDIPVSPRFSPTFFYPDANSALLRAHLCSAVNSKPCVRNCSREREGLYNGNVQQNSLCAASCVTKNIPVSPGFSPTFLSPGEFSTLQCTVFDTLQPKLMHPLVIFSTVHTDQSEEYCFTPRGYKNGILIGQCAHFFIHSSSNGCTCRIRSSLRSQ